MSLTAFLNACFAAVSIVNMCSRKSFLAFLAESDLLASSGEMYAFLGGLSSLFTLLFEYVPTVWAQPLVAANTAFAKFCFMLRGTEYFALKKESSSWMRWMLTFFKTGLKFLSQKNLSSPYSYLAVKGFEKRAVSVQQLLRAIWTRLGAVREQFLDVTYDFVPLLTLPSKELQGFGAEGFNELITTAFTKTGDLQKATESLAKALYTRKNITQGFITLFTNSLQVAFSKQSGPLREKGASFAQSMRLLCTLLKDSHSPLPQEKMFAVYDLCTFMKANNLVELFIAYTLKLKELYLKLKHIPEAGCAVCMHADLYPWSKKTLRPLSIKGQEFPACPAYERKIALYEEAVALFKQAKEYEQIVKIYDGISKAYLDRFWDTPRAIEYLTKEAEIFSKFGRERIIYAFYCVGFYGKRFPESIRNHEFIYKTSLEERYATFSEKIKAQFKDATLLTKPERPGPEVTEADTCALLITPVQISNEAEMERKVLSVRPNTSNIFLYAKPKKIEGVKSDNEFLTVGLVQTFYLTEHALPSATLRTKVIDIKLNEFTPIESAIHAINEKNNDVLNIIAQIKQGMPVNTLTMALNGIISAGVNGGIDKYKDAFLCPKYLAEHPKDVAKVDALKQAIDEQFSVLDKGMAAHKDRSDKEMKQLEDHLAHELERAKEMWQKQFKN